LTMQFYKSRLVIQIQMQLFRYTKTQLQTHHRRLKKSVFGNGIFTYIWIGRSILRRSEMMRHRFMKKY